MTHSGSGKAKNSGEKLIATNPIARQNFFIEEVIEAGIALTGTEIKSIRGQSPNLRDSFVEVRAQGQRLEAWLLNAHIAPYSHGNIWNHEPMRKRKLLLHAHQIDRLFGDTTRKGYTLVPTRMYFKNGRVKLEIGLAKGKTKGDRREDLKRKTDEREMEKAMRQRR
jgi:SsrA-binding protein